MKAEDVFVSVDGVSVEGKNATEVANMLKSNTVKTSKIVIKREGNEINFDVTNNVSRIMLIGDTNTLKVIVVIGMYSMVDRRFK